MAGILRLQRVYKLSTSDMYAGNYSGYTGPALSPLTAYAIGRQAFSDGLLDQSIQWLQLAVDQMRPEAAGRHRQEVTSSAAVDENGVYTSHQRAAVIALLGRAYVFVSVSCHGLGKST